MALFIFDMGNVVCRSVDIMPQLEKAVQIPEAELRAVLRKHKFWGIGEGKISTDEFWKRFSSIFGVEVKEDYFASFFTPVENKQVVSIIKELKEAGHRVVCGTNTVESHYRIHLERGDYSYFDAVYGSHLIGLSKPDRAFYEYILNKEGMDSNGEKVFFTDDLQANVDAAEELGIVSHCFVSAEKLRAFFEEKGVLFNS